MSQNSSKQPNSPSTKSKNTGSLRFQQFWGKYPRREAKGHALKAWEKTGADDDKALFEEIMESVDANLKFNDDWKEALQGNKEKKKYIKLPATWLNALCWEDEIVFNPEKKEKPVFNVNIYKAIGFKNEEEYLKYHTEQITPSILRNALLALDKIDFKYPDFLRTKAGLPKKKTCDEIPW